MSVRLSPLPIFDVCSRTARILEMLAPVSSSDILPPWHPFSGLRECHYGAILADPPWRFKTWNKATSVVVRNPKPGQHRGQIYSSARVIYPTMTMDDIKAMPVSSITRLTVCCFCGSAGRCFLMRWM